LPFQAFNAVPKFPKEPSFGVFALGGPSKLFIQRSLPSGVDSPLSVLGGKVSKPFFPTLDCLITETALVSPPDNFVDVV
jgi:hypothetical protein